MPTYYITETNLRLLEDSIYHGKVLGVGLLSQTIGIFIDQNWQTEPVIVASLYDPNHYCKFEFYKCSAYISNNNKIQKFKW